MNQRPERVLFAPSSGLTKVHGVIPMTQAADIDTRTLRQNDPPEWMTLLEVFTLLTDLIGEFNEALHDIWRAFNIWKGRLASSPPARR